MKTALLILTSILLFSNDPLKIRKINTTKSEAKKAFQAGDYKKAIQQYRYLIDSLGVKEDEINLNLAHAYYLEKDTANAFTNYQTLTNSTNDEVRSKANQQLGIMTNQRGKPEEALSFFKQAVKAHPANEDARYNYEMLKKKLDQKNKEDEKKNKDNKKDNEKNKNEEPSDFAKKLKAQADQMVGQRQYKAAYDLMMDGLKRDKTVSTYQQYINRIKDVSEINKK